MPHTQARQKRYKIYFFLRVIQGPFFVLFLFLRCSVVPSSCLLHLPKPLFFFPHFFHFFVYIYSCVFCFCLLSFSGVSHMACYDQIKKAFCPPEVVDANPILDYCKHILFAWSGEVRRNVMEPILYIYTEYIFFGRSFVPFSFVRSSVCCCTGSTF